VPEILSKMKKSTQLRFLKVTPLCLFFLIFQTSFGQTFNGQGGLPIPPGAPGQSVGITTSTCPVSGIGTLGAGNCSQIANVTLDVLHTWDGDIALFLIGPGGQVLELSSGNGGSGNNFTNTVLSDNAPIFITAGSPPFTGNFRPEGRQTNTSPPFSNANPPGTFTFASTFNGTNADGVWTLLINDFVGGDIGTINSWSITFSGGGSSNMVSLAVNPSPVCQGAAGTVTLTLTFTENTAAGTNYNVVISTTPGGNLTFNNIVPTGLVWTTSVPIPAATTTYALTTISSNVGCQPTISPPSSVVLTVLPPPVANISGDLTICVGQSTTLTASGGNTYSWSNGGNAATNVVTPAANQTYFVTVTDANNCTAVTSANVQVASPPSISLTAPPLVCDGGCQTVTANLTGVAPFSFYFEFQAGGVVLGAGNTVSGSNNSIQFQACPPVGSSGAVQVVVCTLSDLNCNL
jgi:subtilisin-like proprotein convertase family protein